MSEVLNCPALEQKCTQSRHAAIKSPLPPRLPETTQTEAVGLPPGVSREGAASLSRGSGRGGWFSGAYRTTPAYYSRSKYQRYWTAWFGAHHPTRLYCR